jgi:glycosyltransferase involved in cell wall biosynthesis
VKTSDLKLAIVVQRYGLEINGGAEFHARLVAEELARYYRVEVLTTCAYDYVTWANQYKSGVEDINGVPVRRFKVRRKRNPQRFGRIQEFVFNKPHELEDEMRWLKEEGPYSPRLIRHIKARQDDYDYFIFFSYRYYHSYHGITAVPHKSILVPTAEKDPVVDLMIFRKFFNKPRALMYNSWEEKEMINAVSRNQAVPGVVVGVGTELPDESEIDAARFRQRFGIDDPFILYIGRIDTNKGCNVLFDHFLKFVESRDTDLKLVLMGRSIIPIPEHPAVIPLGFVTNQEKFDGLAACHCLVNPSLYESLSMILLESWAVGRPVLVNADVPVLVGQSRRANAGLWYSNYGEFAGALELLSSDGQLREAMGASGRKYFLENYTWEVINQKYIDIIENLHSADREGAGAAS